MTNGAVALLRKRWASLIAWMAAMDYSAADCTNDRISWLEREVEQLKDELRRPPMLPEPPTAASNQVHHPAEPE
jgi:hypothetical protein